jgi:hypothetical protein
MKSILIFSVFSLLTSTAAFALDKALVGAEFIGKETKSGLACHLRIDKIENSFLVDNITVSIRLGTNVSTPNEATLTFGMYDIANGYYVADIGQHEYNFNVTKDGQFAIFAHYHFNRDGMVDMPAFSSGKYQHLCNDLTRINASDKKETPAETIPAD